MNVERINTGPLPGDVETSQAEASRPGFRAPLSREADIQNEAERKARRNRKKRKKALNSAVAQTAQIVPLAAPKPPTARREPGALAMDSGEMTLWERPEDTHQNRASAKLGKKVVGISEQAVPVTSPEHDISKPSDQVSVGERVEKTQPKLSEAETVEIVAAEAQATNEPASNEYAQELEEAAMASQALDQAPAERRLNPFEQSYEQPQIPPQPPNLDSYRRRFWDESVVASTAEPSNENLPALHDYQRQAYEAMPSEPTYSPDNKHYTESPAAVPVANRYESPIPPGYQRSEKDVRRAALTGLLAGWWFGRRGKRKAVERAHKAGAQQGISKTKANQPPAPRYPQLEAEPIHSYQTPESRIVVQSLSTESRPTQLQVAAETTTKVVEKMVSPIAAIEIFDRAINRPALERKEVPLGTKIIISKVAELAVGARSERQLGSREVLRLAKDIKIDGIPLKEIYKAKRIDEAGMRAVVDTYLQGGDVRQQLAEEVTVKERSYERDPVFRHNRQANGERERHTASGSTSSNNSDSVGGSLGQTLGHTLGAVASTTQKTAQTAGKAIASGAKTAQRDLIDNSNTTDWLSITAVVILYSIILILLVG